MLQFWGLGVSYIGIRRFKGGKEEEVNIMQWVVRNRRIRQSTDFVPFEKCEQIREILGQNQKEFAQQLGLRPRTYRENRESNRVAAFRLIAAINAFELYLRQEVDAKVLTIKEIMAK